MAQLSFQFRYRSEQRGEKVFVPIRLQSGNVVTTPLLPHLDTGSPANVFRAEIAEILNIAYERLSRSSGWEQPVAAVSSPTGTR